MNHLKISLGIFVVLAASRFIPHPPNFTSLLALSFYVPAILGIRYLPVLIVSFIITDLVIGFHEVALASVECFKRARPNEKYRFEFTTSSKTIQNRLGKK